MNFDFDALRNLVTELLTQQSSTDRITGVEVREVDIAIINALEYLTSNTATDGVGISSIEKTSTTGLVDTYTITYTDETTSTYTVINGLGIVSNEKTATNGLVDTYTITYTDGSTDTYTVTNGTPGTTLTADQLQIINTVPLVCSDEKTDLTASTDVPVIRFVFQTAQSFTKIVGELNTAAAGGTLTVVAKKNGVSFLSTPLTFDGGENTTRTASVPSVFTTPTVSFSVGDYVEIFITTIGAITPGRGLKIYLM